MDVCGYISQDTRSWPGKICFTLLLPGSEERVSTREWVEELRKAWSTEGVCFKGGEPFRQSDFGIIAKKIQLKKKMVRVETNGAYPDRLKDALNRKVINYVSLEIKAPLNEEIYSKFLPIPNGFERVKESIKLVMESNIAYEFRTVWDPRLTEKDILQITEQIQGCKHYVLVQHAAQDGSRTSREIMRETAQKINLPDVRIWTEEKGEEKVK